MKIENTLLRLLESKLEIAFSEQWHEQRPTCFKINETENGANLAFFLKKGPEEWLSVYEKEIIDLKSEKDVDHVLAEALSVFLMGHYRWPR